MNNVKLPEGCVCDPDSWEGISNVYPICDHFVALVGQSCCDVCNHEPQCHIECEDD